METTKAAKEIDVLDLERTMRDCQSRQNALNPRDKRAARIQNLVLSLQNISDGDFESCLEAVQAMVERLTLANAKRELKKKQNEQTTKETSQTLNSAAREQLV